MGQPSPALVAAVNEQATARGIDPAMLLAVIGYETGGTYDTEIWGGRNNNYFGLIQFGPSERATYGVREGMTPAAQVTAALAGSYPSASRDALNVELATIAGAQGVYWDWWWVQTLTAGAGPPYAPPVKSGFAYSWATPSATDPHYSAAVIASKMARVEAYRAALGVTCP